MRSFRGCLRKRVFYTRIQAKQGKKLYQKEYGKELKIYRCPDCKNFHLATKEPKASI